MDLPELKIYPPPKTPDLEVYFGFSMYPGFVTKTEGKKTPRKILDVFGDYQ